MSLLEFLEATFRNILLVRKSFDIIESNNFFLVARGASEISDSILNGFNMFLIGSMLSIKKNIYVYLAVCYRKLIRLVDIFSSSI